MTNSDDDISKAATLSREIVGDIAEQQERQEEQDKLAARHRGRGGARVGQAAAAVLLVIFVALTALNVAGRLSFGRTTTTPPSDAERTLHLRRTLNYAVRSIEAYRKAHGQWPTSLADVGAPSDLQASYVLDGNGGYSIAVTDGTVTATFDSSQAPDVAFGDLRQP
jgi:hypothetical protein